MAATDIRLIMLATVWHLQPATGYAIRKHLLDQGIESWGGVSVASVYSALKTLTKHGRLEQVDDPTGVRRDTRAYKVTESGRREFGVLWTSAMETVEPARPLAFHVALTLTAFVTRDAYVTALRHRLDTLERDHGTEFPPTVPAQTRNAARLWTRLAETEARWIRQTIDLAEQPGNTLNFTDAAPPR